MQDALRQEQFEAAVSDEAYRRAWLYCCRLAATREDAEDLLQEAIAHAFRKFYQLDKPESFTPWLLAIIRTRFLNSRRRARFPMADSYWLETVQQRQLDHALSDAMLQALGRISNLHREVVCLYYLDGLSQEEAAACLGITVPLLRQRLHRARRALRKVLTGSRAFEAGSAKVMR